ncbi:MAG: hypothetical protein AAF840_09700 [Bacteroidota bacterium]
MKLLTTIFIFFLATAAAFASIHPEDLTVQRDVTSGTLVFRSIIPMENTAKVQIVDWFGNAIYSGTLNQGDFLNKRFREAGFKSKSYRLIITDTVGRTTLPFQLRPSGQLVDLAKADCLAFPQVDIRDERMLVVDYKNKSGKRVDIRIANREGETVFSDSVNGTKNVQRAYQLNQLSEGDYQIIVSARELKDYTLAFALR